MTDVLSPTAATPDLDRQRRYGLRPPNPALRYLEARVFLELAALAASARELRSEPRGDGRKVVLMPGFLADDRRSAKHIEVASSHVGLGFNADVWRIIARVLGASPTEIGAATGT